LGVARIVPAIVRWTAQSPRRYHGSGTTVTQTTLPTVPPRETRERLRLRALQEIARERFGFPNERHPHLKTFVNQPERTMGVTVDSDVLYPDIVVLQWPEKITQMVAQVEAASAVTEQRGLDEWLPYSLAGPLYLFVPVGYAREAKRICRRFRIAVVGLRTWRYMVGFRDLEITDIETAAKGLEALLPGFLTQLLARRDRRG
jgi:hypothetical protein